MEIRLDRETQKQQISIITSGKIKSRVTDLLNGIDLNKAGERNLLRIETETTGPSDNPDSISLIALLNDVPAAIYSRTLDKQKITEEHYVLMGKDKKDGNVKLELFENHRNKQTIPAVIGINFNGRTNVRPEMLEINKLQEIADIFWGAGFGH